MSNRVRNKNGIFLIIKNSQLVNYAFPFQPPTRLGGAREIQAQSSRATVAEK